MKIGSLFTGIGGLELGVCDTVTSIVPYGNDIEWIAETIESWEGIFGREAPPLAKPKGWVTDADDVSRTAKLAALGDACTPQQASEAFYHGLLQLTRERTSR